MGPLRVRFTIRRMLVVVALAALVLGVWRWTDLPTPEARALELALSVPTSSDYEATAIYQAAIYQERISPGALTKRTELPKVKVSGIPDGRLLPLSWSVLFTDRRSGNTQYSRCVFSPSNVNEFQTFRKTGIPPTSPAPKGRLVGRKQAASSSDFLFVLLIAWLLVSATRTRGGLGERSRRAGAALLAILCGPLVGAALAWLRLTVGDAEAGREECTSASAGGVVEVADAPGS
jgi:hypothetical protein